MLALSVRVCSCPLRLPACRLEFQLQHNSSSPSADKLSAAINALDFFVVENFWVILSLLTFPNSKISIFWFSTLLLCCHVWTPFKWTTQAPLTETIYWSSWPILTDILLLVFFWWFFSLLTEYALNAFCNWSWYFAGIAQLSWPWPAFLCCHWSRHRYQATVAGKNHGFPV